ncbi:MAG: DUF177 domain-containing protein, partial [Prevotella sp.]|nr:DUF177 domain-containing protein [Prevotella sp.]
MCSLKTFDIDLKNLKEAETVLEFDLDDKYFSAIDAPEVSKGDVSVEVAIKKTTERIFELEFHIEGEVVVLCDRCLDEMTQDIETDGSIVAKFGDEDSDNDDLVMVDENEGILNIAWLVYEFIALAIPIKHVHAPGKCNSAMIKMLEEHST